MSRKQNIELLKNIQTGRTTVKELTMPAVVHWYCDKDGFYTGPVRDKLTKEKFETYRAEHPAKKTIVFKYQHGNEPLDE